MSDASHSPIPESDTLARLQRAAEREPDFVKPTRIGMHVTFRAAGEQLKQWRKAVPVLDTPTKELTDVDMEATFPSIIAGPTKPRLNRWKAHQVRQTLTRSRSKRKAAARSASPMGLFQLLPGELRNYIYRLAFVPPSAEQPVLISGSDLVCGVGACVHKRVSIAAPGLASTCRQIRRELMPIFCAENAFRLDAVVVRNRCGGNWVRSLGAYARLIGRVELEVAVLTRSLVDEGVVSRVCEVVVGCPAGRADGRFAVAFGAGVPGEKAKTCGLERVVEGLKGGGGGLRRSWRGLWRRMSWLSWCFGVRSEGGVG
ncbi:hypothetical protein LTR08_004812 [Meristemomyces frigidus]|nr:hypothetical protein LTR08_004812 [Meristemomyces frigidus]